MAGYWRDPTGTAEVLRDGWLHTGDVGHLDANDLLTITGRRRELIVTSGGKNVSPLLLESQLTADPLIHQAVVIGEGRSYLTALVVPEFELLRRTLATVSDPHTSPKRKRGNATGQGTEASPIPSLALRASMPAERLIEDAGVVALFRDRIDACLAELARDEQIRRFTLLAQPLSVETGELSPKLSLRRAAIQQRHARTIDAMYDT